jgi:hypothetical protein
MQFLQLVGDFTKYSLSNTQRRRWRLVLFGAEVVPREAAGDPSVAEVFCGAGEHHERGATERNEGGAEGSGAVEDRDLQVLSAAI